MWPRRSKTVPTLPIPASGDDLALIGRQAFPSDSIPTQAADVSRYYLPALEASGFPSPPSDLWGDFVDRFLAQLIEIVDAADSGWALAGAFEVARDLLGGDVSNPRYAELVDRTLLLLRDSGVPYQFVPPFALNRWYENVGMVGLRPADWPASIVPS
jgi:hypothetical protein